METLEPQFYEWRYLKVTDMLSLKSVLFFADISRIKVFINTEHVSARHSRGSFPLILKLIGCTKEAAFRKLGIFSYSVIL